MHRKYTAVYNILVGKSKQEINVQKDNIKMNHTLIMREMEYLRQNTAMYRGADKSLARPGRKQATATEDFGDHISYL
jgi:hypothetical protein